MYENLKYNLLYKNIYFIINFLFVFLTLLDINKKLIRNSLLIFYLYLAKLDINKKLIIKQFVNNNIKYIKIVKKMNLTAIKYILLAIFISLIPPILLIIVKLLPEILSKYVPPILFALFVIFIPKLPIIYIPYEQLAILIPITSTKN